MIAQTGWFIVRVAADLAASTTVQSDYVNPHGALAVAWRVRCTSGTPANTLTTIVRVRRVGDSSLGATSGALSPIGTVAHGTSLGLLTGFVEARVGVAGETSGVVPYDSVSLELVNAATIQTGLQAECNIYYNVNGLPASINGRAVTQLAT